MRGLGDPRAIAVLASLPERGLRGCAILAPKVLHRSSYSGAAGRGRGGVGVGRGGIGSAQSSDGAPIERGRPQEEIGAQRESDGSADEVANGRFAEWKTSASTQNRVSSFSAQQGGDGGGIGAAGRGRGVPFSPQQQQQEQNNVVREAESSGFGRGRGISLVPPGDSGRGRWISAPSPAMRVEGSVGRGIPLGGNENVSERPNAAALDGDDPQGKVDLGHKGSEQGAGVDHPLPSTTEESKKSAIQDLLSRLGGQSKPQVSLNPESSAPEVKPRLPFRMPFARLSPTSEQQQKQDEKPEQPPQQPMSAVPPPPEPLFQQPLSAMPPKPMFQAPPSAPWGPLGRGRGQPGVVVQPEVGADPELRQMPPRRLDRRPDGVRRDSPRPPSPPRMQLSVEEARARAISILEQGIEKNVAAEGERRRKAGMEKFADATEFLTDRFNRAQGPSPPSQPQTSRNERQRPSADSRRHDRPRRRRSDEEATTVSESAVVPQLTVEQEAQILRLQEEDTFKERLHTLFLVQFEPEFAMEEFGRNPDIDEPPVLPLEEYLQSHKPFFLPEDADLSQEQKWQEAVKTSLANAPDLEKLVEAYAGPGRMTARQQIEKLQTISQKLPPTVSPEVAAFTQRAFLTLQNNPRLNMHQKEKLMTNIVTGFS
ncbi:unnamed protein product [Calypogeia fissa]